MDVNQWLNGNKLSIDIWTNKYRYAEESLEDWFNRVSSGDPNIKRLLKEKKFIFGGRTLANVNTAKRASYSNCYSHGFVNDSLRDIMETATNIAMTFKSQGGQGISLSKIRPRGANIDGSFCSDGIIPFMELYNKVTESISQGGSRKGALLMSLDIWHPEAKDFITIKSDLNRINKANLSMEIDDSFMEDVMNGVTKRDMVFKYKGGEYPYTVNPVELYKELCRNACKYAEPGVIFTNEFRNYNIMQYVDSYQIETCNPCGEQPLPKHGACNLSSINLSEYVLNPFTKNARIDYAELSSDIPYIVKAMDDILEKNLPNHALPEQREMAYNYRNIGIGICGLADMLVKLGVTYGSDDGIAMAGNVMKTIFRECVKSSVALARERGNFPMYDKRVWDSDIMRNAFSEHELEEFKEMDLLRNCSLVSIAPTGSIGTMLNVSTGCEPFFMLSYKRRTESLNNGEESYYDVNIPIVDEYKEKTGNDELPDYFVTANDIDWKQRVLMQAALQKYCDTAISSTINLPRGTTPTDIEGIYIESWKNGLKGVTVYVDGSRDPILSKDGGKDKDNPNIVPSVRAPKRPKELEADLYPVQSRGKQYIVLVGLLNGKPYEVFAFEPKGMKMNLKPHKGVIIKRSKKNYAFKSEVLEINELELANENIEERASTIYTSMLLRHGVDIKYIIKTAKKVNQNITSFSSAMCRVLSKYMAAEEEGGKCPDCGGTLIREGGCIHCKDCGWSACN